MIQDFIKKVGFIPKENTKDIYIKKYKDSYIIEIDFQNEIINYGDKIICENKTTQNFSQAENFVILECVNRLLEKGYKPENIILERTWKLGHQEKGRLDILVKKEDKAYLMIECKTFDKEFDEELKKMKKDGGQLFSYFQQDKSAEILMLYSSKLENNKIICKNEIVKIEDEYRLAPSVKDFYDKWNKLTKKNGVWESPLYDFKPISLTIDQLVEIKQKDSSFIFNRFLEILRHNVVSDKPNAFNKIFNLFLCKIYDEKEKEGTNKELDFQWKEGIDDDVKFQLRLTDLFKSGMKDFLEKKVTDFSDTDFENQYASIFAGNDDLKAKFKNEVLYKLRLEKNNEFAIKEVYDQKSFVENAKVVKEVVELLQNFKIRYSKKQQYLSDFFELLLTTGLKQESGQFFTPVPIAQFIIKSLPIDKIVEDKLIEGKKDELLPYVIDNAAGSGHFLTESMHEIQRLLLKVNKNNLKSEAQSFIEVAKIRHFDWALQYVYGIEKDYRLVKVGKVGCYLHGDGLANIIHSDGLSNFKHKDYKGKLRETDIDFPQENKQFDILISNPPYSVSAFKNASREYYKENDFELYEKLTDTSSEIECLFIERTKQLLKDGGVAGIILPSSILSNTGIYSKSRKIILKFFDIIGITELGSKTFMATGTNTVILFLRRRNNYISINLERSVKVFLSHLQDFTIKFGDRLIERPFSSYVNYVWNNCTFEDYISFIKKEPNKNISNHEIYKEYKKKIKTQNESEFWNIVLKREEEKLNYFIIACQQKVVLVKSGDNKTEKSFLGYEFRNRRGREGIHPIHDGRSIEECTQLFDPNVFDNPKKASTYIYKAFSGDFEFTIDTAMQNNVDRVDLLDLLTFDRSDFENSINLNSKKKIKTESKYPKVKLENLVSIQSGLWTGKKEPLTIAKVIRNTNFKENNGKLNLDDVAEIEVEEKQLEERKLSKHDIILEKSGGSETQAIGRVVLFEEDENITYTFSNFCSRIRVLDKSQLHAVYLWAFLNDFYVKGGTIPLQNGIRLLNIDMQSFKNIKIPLPPLNIQQKIVFEIEVLEAQEKKAKEEVVKLRNSISNLMELNTNFEIEKLENLAIMLKRGKSAKYGDSEIQIIKSGQARGLKEFDFSQKHFVVKDFILDERKLEKGDILINSSGVGTAGRVTMFNLNGVFVVDSHITILRPNKEIVLPDYILQSLAKIGFKNIEAMAMGQSGQIELTISTIQNIKIPLPPLSVQQKIVAEIEKIEEKIKDLETAIVAIPKQKEAVLKKYL